MLVRLMYASRATAGVDAEELSAILRQSRGSNPARGITGALCLASGNFIQVLEGSRVAVNELYHHIASDPRHTGVTLLSYQEVTERRFAGWSMGQVQLSRLNPAVVLKYSETTALDPFGLSAQAVDALFDELLASAVIIGVG
jgi:hypothetical protein